MSYSEKSLDRKFSTLFSIIFNRCVIAEEPTIVCLGRVNKVNTIRVAKNTMPDFKIGFMKNIFRWTTITNFSSRSCDWS